ncbi:hypothetical protein E4656_19545 [Natronospirillum operosum]|uniref:Uncharacterized protein n=1 Tax=Natronospirillum operosum TaxID=2759953 RepID=A0A4Z0W6C5_9GAMM|nr:hypothetical protein [Natronospirillum operosum]TGG90064.1 hypothetical protein E4656_19545 [Natronospirillum operosum]
MIILTVYFGGFGIFRLKALSDLRSADFQLNRDRHQTDRISGGWLIVGSTESLMVWELAGVLDLSSIVDSHQINMITLTTILMLAAKESNQKCLKFILSLKIVME